MSFPPESRERLGSYVYALCDPRVDRDDPKRIFYVGKGVGDRCFSHAKGSIEALANGQNAKLELIREIIQSDSRGPTIEMIVHGLNDYDAKKIEAHLINLLPGLTNISSGHRHADYWLTIDEVNSRYAQPVSRDKIDGAVLFVSLNKTYPDVADSPRLLKDCALGDWPISAAKARQVDHIICVFRQLVRVIFTVDRNSVLPVIQTIAPKEKCKQIRHRWISSAVYQNDELEKTLALKSIIDKSGNVLTKFGQRPVRFSPPEQC
jgi:uncharacterized protein